MDPQANLSWAWPWAVLLLPLVWLLQAVYGSWWRHLKLKQQPALLLPNLPLEQAKAITEAGRKLAVPSGQSSSWSFAWWRRLGLQFLQLPHLIFICLVVALMRPEVHWAEIAVPQQLRQLILVVDISGSMREQLEGRSRLEQVKQVVHNFVQQRPEDNLGLVVFGSQAYVYVPPTWDHSLLLEQLQGLRPGMAGAGTAIGDAVGVALQLLQASSGQPGIILLTDGANNAGQLTPLAAVQMAQAMQVPVYFLLLSPETAAGVETGLEPDLVQAVQATGGRTFSAFSSASLARVYQEVHQLEPQTQLQYIQPAQALGFIPVLVALGLALYWVVLIKLAAYRNRQARHG